MEALILAAGLGSRLGRTSAGRPKALLEFAGEPLISRMVRQCHENGVVRFTVVLGFGADVVRDELVRSHPGIQFDFVTNEDFATTNNIVSLLMGFDRLRETSPGAEVVVLECDVALVDDAMRSFLAAPTSDIALVSPFEAGMDGTVVRVRDGRISELITTAHQGPRFDFAGTFKTVNVYRLSWDLWSRKLARLLEWFVEEVSDRAYYENAIGMIAYASQSQVGAFVIPVSDWHEIDDPNDLRIAEAKLSLTALRRELATSHGGWWDFDITDFTYLRNMHFPPPALIAQLRERLESALWNYGSSQAVLDRKLSWFLDTDAEHTLALPGLSALYPTLARRLAPERVLIPSPTFGEYAARIDGAIAYDATLPIDAIAARIDSEGATAVVIVNPNNPTGTLHPTGGIVALARSRPDVLVLVDESFLPFVDQDSVSHTSEDITNVLVLASLSKSMGVPGLRLGFAWSRSTDLIEALRAEQPIWALGSLAEVFLTLSLKFKAEYLQSLATSRADKLHFEGLIDARPGLLSRPDVHGDFVLVDVLDVARVDRETLITTLLAAGMHVKDVSDRLDPERTTLRLAVRLPEENARMAAILSEAVTALGGRA